jgi:hypothetical protein
MQNKLLPFPFRVYCLDLLAYSNSEFTPESMEIFRNFVGFFGLWIGPSQKKRKYTQGIKGAEIYPRPRGAGIHDPNIRAVKVNTLHTARSLGSALASSSVKQPTV